MSIATEITRIKTAKADIKSAIEEKGVEVGDGTIDTYAKKIGEISGVGNNPLEYAVGLREVYRWVSFQEGYEITLNVPNITVAYQTFRDVKGLKKLKLKGNEGNRVVEIYGFLWSSDVQTLDLTEFNAKVGNAQYMCNYCTDLESILGEIDFSECTNVGSAFYRCDNLVTLTPKANTIKLSISFASSSKLSDLSIQSIIDGLADLTGGTQQTLTLHSKSGVKLTEEQKTTITAKNWELVY